MPRHTRPDGIPERSAAEQEGEHAPEAADTDQVNYAASVRGDSGASGLRASVPIYFRLVFASIAVIRVATINVIRAGESG